MLWCCHVFSFSSCSQIRWRGETDRLLGLARVSRMFRVDERLKDLSWTKEVGDVTKENVFVLGFVWSLS